MEEIISLRNKIISLKYSYILKPILFRIDPERVHKFFIKFGKVLQSKSFSKKFTSLLFNYGSPILNQNLKGINFKNPVGLSAGFDKNAEVISIMEDVGFGFVEVGSITSKSCPGNPGKRLKRLPEKKSLWVYFGLNNDGVDKISNKLKGKTYLIPYGISIAPTNCKENLNVDLSVEDYFTSYKKILKNNIGDYITINISCPNAEGSQPYLNPKNYEKILKKLSTIKKKKPLFVKISPDLSAKDISMILRISHKYNLDGIICTNLTKKHIMGKGGLSGRYISSSSDKLLIQAYREKKKNNYNFILVGVGGIFTPEDAYRKIKLGANLVQLITGMIYQGPQTISSINQGLVKMLKKDGFNSIENAVGIEVK